MPNVSFYRQTTGSTATGAITFDTTNKYIYLGDGSTAHKFDCNNTTYTFTADDPTLWWETTKRIGTVGGTTLNVTMPSRPNLKLVGMGTTNANWAEAFDPIKAAILSFLNDTSSANGRVMYVDFVIESNCVLAAYSDADNVCSSGRFVIPYHGMAFTNIDETKSDRSEAVNIVSTPIVIASSNSIQSCLIILQFGGSTGYGEWVYVGIKAVTPTNINSTTDLELPGYKLHYAISYGDS